jgi:hypothetical protein
MAEDVAQRLNEGEWRCALLQLPHRMAERRWRDPELRRRGSKTQTVCDSDERRQVGQVAAIHC